MPGFVDKNTPQALAVDFRINSKKLYLVNKEYAGKSSLIIGL